jgi:hypothetical protein
VPDSKVSDLTELAATPAADDELVVVDKSDTTQAASGTTKRLRADRLYSMPGNVTLGDDASDSLTVNAGTWVLGSNYVATRAAGTLAGSSLFLQDHQITFSGDAGGATQGSGMRVQTTASGSNAMVQARSLLPTLTLTTSAGATTIARTVHSSLNVEGAGTATTASVFEGVHTLISSGGITTANVFLAAAPALTSTGAITTLVGHSTRNLGHATLVTNALGFDHADFTAAATLTVGFRSQMSSGTGKWGFQHNGTANNAFAGNTRIGSVVAPTVALDVTGSAAVSGDTTLGSDSSDTLTVNAGTWTLGSNYTATRAAGALAAGQTILQANTSTASGHSGGTTDAIGIDNGLTVSGANALTAATAQRSLVTVSTSAGATTAATASSALAILTGAGTVTSANVSAATTIITGAGGVTTATSFTAAAPIFTSTGAITNNFGFQAKNLGHATLVANATGFYCEDFTLGAATLQAGFRSQMTSGTGKWAFYSSGTASSGHAGSFRIGSTVAPTETLDVTGTLATSGINALGTTTSATTNLNLPAGATGVSSLRIAQGVAPSSPVDGDVWTTALGPFVDTSGGTRGPFGHVLAASGAQIADKGNVTSEQTFVTVTIPANALGANGQVRVWTTWNHTNSANDKTLRVKFGGTNFHGVVSTTTVTTASLAQIQNRNATNSQTAGTSITGGGLGSGATNPVTAAIDTTAAVTLLITGQKETGTETLTLERYLVEVIPSA